MAVIVFSSYVKYEIIISIYLLAMNNCKIVPIAGRKGQIYLPPRMRPVWRVHPDQTGAIRHVNKVL